MAVIKEKTDGMPRACYEKGGPGELVHHSTKTRYIAQLYANIANIPIAIFRKAERLRIGSYCCADLKGAIEVHEILLTYLRKQQVSKIVSGNTDHRDEIKT